MLLKSVDDKSRRLTLLGELHRSQLVDRDQKKWLRDELIRLRKGIQGERESAHYLDNYFKDRETHVILHDLRLVVDGEVAQIDHLIFNRASKIYLLETKNYACNLVINERGEFTAEYEHERFGIPSPIEQSRRHERVLCKLLERLDIVGRTQKAPDFHHVVLFHPRATIERPPAHVFDTSNVIKADQFPSWHQKFVETLGIGTVLKSALNMRSLETIRQWGEKLARQHRPADLLALPDFMQPREPRHAKPASAISTPASNSDMRSSGNAQDKVTSSVDASLPIEEPVRRLVCANCGTKISFAEGKFCWNNAPRFGGLQYCRAHQVLL